MFVKHYTFLDEYQTESNKKTHQKLFPMCLIFMQY